MEIGDRVTSTVTFKNAAGAVVDPSTVTVKIRAPSGTITTYVYGVGADVTKSGTGVYACSFTLNAANTWYCRWNGTGAAVASTEVEINVDRSAFASPL